MAVPNFWGTEGETKEFKGWSDKWAEEEMGLGEEKQKRLAQSFRENSELLRTVLQPAKNWRRNKTQGSPKRFLHLFLSSARHLRFFLT